MPDESADRGQDADNSLVERWADIEQPFGDPEDSELIPEGHSVSSSEPEEPDTETLSRDLSNVDPDLLNTFAVCVLLANLGVLLVSVGALVVIFRGQLQIGGGLVVVGSLSLLRVWQYYRSYKADRETDDETASDPDAESTTDHDTESTTGRDAESTTEQDNANDASGHNR